MLQVVASNVARWIALWVGANLDVVSVPSQLRVHGSVALSFSLLLRRYVPSLLHGCRHCRSSAGFLDVQTFGKEQYKYGTDASKLAGIDFEKFFVLCRRVVRYQFCLRVVLQHRHGLQSFKTCTVVALALTQSESTGARSADEWAVRCAACL